MARSHYRGTVYGNLTTGAKPLPGAAIRLFHPDTGQPWTLPVYPDPVNGVPYALPIHTNSVGELELWAEEPARVRAEVSHPSFHSAGEVIEIRLDPGETATDTDVVESVADHEAKEDPHDQYLTEEEGNLLYKPLPWEPDLSDYYTRGEADDEFLDQDEADLRYEQLSRKGMPSGYAPLDFAGVIPPVYLPPLAITETWVVVSEAEMLALPAQQGDVAVRLDTTENYILRVDPATVLANWTKLAASTTAGNTSVLRREEFTPSPLATTVTLAAPPTTVHAVSRNGVGQSQPAGHYSLSGLVLTFTDPFELGERVAVVYEIGSTVPAPVNGYTKEESDLRYEPLDTMYTKEESDLRYQPLGSYAATAHNHDASYLPLTGGTLTGDLTIHRTGATIYLKRVTDTQPRAFFGSSGFSFGPGGSTVPDNSLTRQGANEMRGDFSFVPSTTNARDLGTTALRWRKLWAVDIESTNVPTVGGVALPTSAGIAAAYLPLVGGTLTGSLGIGQAPTTWPAGMSVLHLGGGSVLAFNTAASGDGGTLTTAYNTRAATPWDWKAVVTGMGTLFTQGPDYRWRTAPSVAAGVSQVFTERMVLSNTGTLSLVAAAGSVLVIDKPDAANYLGYFSFNRQGAAKWHLGLGPAEEFMLYNSNLSKIPFRVTTTGTTIVSTDSGAAGVGVQGEGGLQLLGNGGDLVANASTGKFRPINETMHCGASGQRWAAVWCTTGSLSTSVYEAKQDFTPLDPAACATAVLETDWVDFSYRAALYVEPPPQEGQAPEERSRQVDEGRVAYAQTLVETAPSRHQKGYVLQSPTHKTHDLFGLDDRESASPGSDLAVVACALQHALQEIADLKAQVGALSA